MVISIDYTLNGLLDVNDLTVQSNTTLTLKDSSRIIIHGNLMVNGHIADQGSELEFTGTDQQVISGNGSTITLYNITDSNTSSGGLLCENDINLIGTLKLNENTKIDVDGVSDDKKFTLVSNAKGTARIAAVEKGAVFRGNIIQERYIGKGASGHRYVSTAIKNQTLASWQDDARIQGVVQQYPNNDKNISYFVDEYSSSAIYGIDGWKYYGNLNESLPVGRGIAFYMWGSLLSNTTKLDNFGQLFIGNGDEVTGTYDYTLSKTSTAYGGGGWHLLGNIYPCELDWNSPNFIHKDLNGNSFSVWHPNSGSYAAYNGISGTNGGIQYIASGVAFWVTANSERSEVSVNEHAKAIFNGNTYLGRATPYENVPKFRLKISSEDGYSDEAAFAFVEEASDGLDNRFDALKLNGEHVNLASLLNNNKTEIAINVMNSLAGIKRVILRVKPCQSGNYVFDVTQFENIDNQTVITLVDRYENKRLVLGDKDQYRFAIDLNNVKTYDDNRFEIVFEKRMV